MEFDGQTFKFDDGSVGTLSMNPGVSALVTVNPAIGSVTSQTYDPPTPLEYGRTVS